MATCAPGTSTEVSASSIFVTEAESLTTMVFSPSLYLTVMRLPVPLPATSVTVAFVMVLAVPPFAAGATLVTVAFVIVLPGRRSIGRWPSPRPRIDSGNTRSSVATNVPSGCGTAVVAMKAPGVSASSFTGDRGVIDVLWGTWPDDGASWRATVGAETGRNRLRVDIDVGFYERVGIAAAKVAVELLDGLSTTASELSVVVAAPSHLDFVRSFSSHSGIDEERVVVAPETHWHTVAFVGALQRAHEEGLLTHNGTALFVCAGSGITAGAALYRT